jgi:hypothetical protein
MPALQPSTLSPFVSKQFNIASFANYSLSNGINSRPHTSTFSARNHYQRRSTTSSTPAFSLSCNKVRKPDTGCTPNTTGFFFCRENEHRGKLMLILVWLLDSSRHCIRSLFFLSSFFFGSCTSQRLFSSHFVCIIMENLGNAPFRYCNGWDEIDCIWDFLLHTFQKELMVKQIGVLRVVDQPYNLQIFPLVRKLLRRKPFGQTVAASSGEWKTRKHPHLTYATGRNHFADGGRVELLRCKIWWVFCIWSLVEL